MTRQVVRALLLLVVGLGTLAQVLLLPTASDVDTAVAHAQEGRVRTVQLYEGSPGGFRVRVGPRRDPGPALVWTDRRGRLHEAQLPDDAASSDVDLLATVVGASPAGSRPDVLPPGGLLRDRAASLGSAAVLLLLVLLLTGPQPRRATKWGWFWFTTALPVSTGALLLLAREAPWSRATTAEPEPAPGVAEPGVRTSGGRALLFAVAVSLVLGVVGIGAASLVPGLLSRYEQPEPYEVVQQDGTRVPGPVVF